MQLWLCPLFAFLLGSIPFGLFIAKSKGIDIREHGSGNIGATNVFRIVGKKYGLGCLLLDAFKGIIPVVIVLNLVQQSGHSPLIPLSFLNDFLLILPESKQFTVQLIHILTGLAAILGHNYSPWIGFKGGKGIATSAGVLIGLMPAAVLLLIVIFIATLLVSRYVAVASMACAAALPVLTHLGARFHTDKTTGMSLWEAGTWNKPLFFFALTIGILAIWKHRTNIRRLLDGTEDKFVWGGGGETANA